MVSIPQLKHWTCHLLLLSATWTQGYCRFLRGSRKPGWRMQVSRPPPPALDKTLISRELMFDESEDERSEWKCAHVVPARSGETGAALTQQRAWSTVHFIFLSNYTSSSQVPPTAFSESKFFCIGYGEYELIATLFWPQNVFFIFYPIFVFFFLNINSIKRRILFVFQKFEKLLSCVYTNILN